VKNYSDRMLQLKSASQDERRVMSKCAAEKTVSDGRTGKGKVELSHDLKAPALIGTNTGFGGTRIVPASTMKLSEGKCKY
jgi:hypothetical protein